MKALTSKNGTGPVAAAQADGEDGVPSPRRPLRDLTGDGLLDELLDRSLDEAAPGHRGFAPGKAGGYSLRATPP
jgi:hypothetical protein